MTVYEGFSTRKALEGQMDGVVEKMTKFRKRTLASQVITISN